MFTEAASMENAHRRTGKVLVRHDCPAEGVEAPVYLAHDQVANYEADVGVSRVEFPRPGDEARDLGDAVSHRFSFSMGGETAERGESGD